MATLIQLCSFLAVCRTAFCQPNSETETSLRLLDPASLSHSGASLKYVRNMIENNWKVVPTVERDDESYGSIISDTEVNRELRDISSTGSGEYPNSPSPAVDSMQENPFLSLTPGNLSLIIDTLVSAILSYSSKGCRMGWEDLFDSGSSREAGNSVRALDAFGKIAAGFLEGNRFAFGNYDECHSLSSTQYCLTELEIENLQQQAEYSLLYAMCLPQMCSEEDIKIAVNITSSELDRVVKVDEIYCESESKAPYNTGSIVIIFLWCSFGLMVVVATSTQFLMRKLQKVRVEQKKDGGDDLEMTKPRLLTKRKNKISSETFMKLLLSFSLYKTVPKILAINKQPDSAITCLHGIRVMSMCWVILGHISIFTYLYLENRISYVKNSVSDFSYRGITGSVFAVDSFFLMSGLLVTYLTLRHMERGQKRMKEKAEKEDKMLGAKGEKKLDKRKLLFTFPALQYYVHRFLRITPVYAFVLFSYWLLTVHLATGPLWRKTIGESSHFYQSCKTYWWTNFLYINNLYPQRHLDICMPWSWYLANDMQFYIIAPLIIIPLALYPRIGLGLIALLVLANLAVIGSISGAYGYTSNNAKVEELEYAVQGTDSNHNVTDDIYTKPWARVGPYLIGILMGFILYKQQQKPVFTQKKYNYVFYGCLWIIAAVLCSSTVYGLQGPFSGNEFNRVEDISYQTFTRLAWAVGLAIIVFACHNGYGWIINDLLSMKFWIPLSRLTFTAYLVHGIVFYVLLFTNRRPFFADNVSQTVTFISAVVLSFSSAAVISSIVEFPLSNVEEIVFKLAGFGPSDSTRRLVTREKDCETKKNLFELEEGERGERKKETREELTEEKGGENMSLRKEEKCEIEIFENLHAEGVTGEGEEETEEGRREEEKEGEQEEREEGGGVIYKVIETDTENKSSTEGSE